MKRLLAGFQTRFVGMASTQQQDELPVAMIVKRFKEYLLDNQRDQLLEVLTHPDDTKHFGIYIRYYF